MDIQDDKANYELKKGKFLIYHKHKAPKMFKKLCDANNLDSEQIQAIGIKYNNNQEIIYSSDKTEDGVFIWKRIN
ncbi:hypothetical protein [Campylobacter sp. US33a]|uniref:hypothetical protein n=1 Tax=Campylobacter sp. US33a TaxID=2498120 RepID=UPI001067DF31|nr:hypothetical protein [Campylobacter sp. US33a]TEY00730.1 hypothetical protein ELQ16_08835 [Campylobacter sp. US33a]